MTRNLVHKHAERLQWSIVHAAMNDAAVRDAFAFGTLLPSGFAASFTERVVEYPWALIRLSNEGLVLDAGSTFNHAELIRYFEPRRLIITTLEPEAENFVADGVSYLFADLRHLPLGAESVNQVLCISVLEHVGMDNRLYGSAIPASDAPTMEARAAFSELLRIMRPGGRLLLSVPYGQRMNMGWQRQFDRADLEALLEGISPVALTITTYARNEDGWQVSSLDQAADRVYAGGASAVACIDACL